MSGNKEAARIAILGLGSGALQALAERWDADSRVLQIDVFDPSPRPGAGPNFDPKEPPYCLLKIPCRDIAIRPPKGSAVGSFVEWQGGNPDPDVFPTRADLGRYLSARCADVIGRGFAHTHCSI